jgi:hypothetical protein
MGKNYYTADGRHIGKFSAAGVYCHDCKATLCKIGKDGIHKERSAWYMACPSCTKLEDQLPTVCSFTWAMEPNELIGKAVMVRDEYGRYETTISFGRSLRLAPFHFY